MNIARLATMVALSLSMLGCSSLLKVSRLPFTTYSPQYSAPESGAHPARVDWQLLVETPLASNSLDSAHMVVMPEPGVIEVMPGARWSDPAPVLLRRVVVEGFEASGRIVGVGSAATGMSADFALAIELRGFQLETTTAGGASAKIAFQAHLLDYASNRVLASHAFSAQAPAASADAASAFAAFQNALNQVVSELVNWTLDEGNRAVAKRQPSG